MIRNLRRLLYLLFAAELLYLLVANLLFNTDLPRRALNREPDRLQVQWERALTPFPGIYWVKGLSLRIRTPRSRAWLEADSALGRIGLLGLARRELRIHWLRIDELGKLYLRPRPPAERAQSEQSPSLPLIGSAPSTAGAVPEDEPPSWTIDLRKLEVHGLRDARVWGYRFGARGDVELSVRYRTGGELRIDRAEGALELETLLYDGRPIAGPLALDASFRILPYLPGENRGAKMLRYLGGEFSAAGTVSNLDFIGIYLGKVPWLRFSGGGELAARLTVEQGRVQPGSRFEVSGAKVEADVKRYRIRGAGIVRGAVERPGAGQPVRSGLEADFRPVEIYLGEADTGALYPGRTPAPLIEGTRLRLSLRGSPPEFGKAISDPLLSIELEEARIPDLARLNPLLPEKMGRVVEAGSGRVSGRFRLGAAGGSGSLELRGAADRARLGGHRYRFDFEGGIRLEITDGKAYRLDGSRISLFNARSLDAGTPEAGVPPWSASLEIERGELEPVDWRRLPAASSPPEVESLVRLANGELRLRGGVSDIGFLNPMLAGVEGLRLGGRGSVLARVRVAGGEPASGSTLQVVSGELAVDYLDYTARGAGKIDGSLLEADGKPMVRIEGSLDGVTIRRAGDGQEHVRGGKLDLVASGRGTSFSEQLEELQVELEIPRAPIPDLRVYNDYLPTRAGIRLTGGEGKLGARFSFRGERVSGEMGLSAGAAEMEVNGRRIRGAVDIWVPLRNGTMVDRVFDIDRATLRMEELRGETGAEPWSGLVQVRRGRVKWKQPLALDAEVGLRLGDSGPLVYLFAPGRKRAKWLDQLLTIRDIRGFARVAMDDRSLVLNHLRIAGEGVDLRAHLRFLNRQVEGLLYARLGRLSAAVELKEGEVEWSLVGAQRKFSAYPPFPVRLPVLETTKKAAPAGGGPG